MARVDANSHSVLIFYQGYNLVQLIKGATNRVPLARHSFKHCNNIKEIKHAEANYLFEGAD